MNNADLRSGDDRRKTTPFNGDRMPPFLTQGGMIFTDRRVSGDRRLDAAEDANKADPT